MLPSKVLGSLLDPDPYWPKLNSMFPWNNTRCLVIFRHNPAQQKVYCLCVSAAPIVKGSTFHKNWEKISKPTWDSHSLWLLLLLWDKFCPGCCFTQITSLSHVFVSTSILSCEDLSHSLNTIWALLNWNFGALNNHKLSHTFFFHRCFN